MRAAGSVPSLLPLVAGFGAAVVDDVEVEGTDVEVEGAGDDMKEANALVAFDADGETDGAVEEPKNEGWFEAGGLKELVAEGAAELAPNVGVLDEPKPPKPVNVGFGVDDVAGCT